MAFRYSLKHHPAAAQDFSDSRAWFAEIDKDLAELFASDFQTALRGIASGNSGVNSMPLATPLVG